jgi:hypothetical protein
MVMFLAVAVAANFESQIIGYLIPTKGWITFNIPGHAKPIGASIQRSNTGLEICNQDTADWKNVTVKITGIYHAFYLARAKPIKAGKCEQVSFSNFAEPSWKRMRMPPNEKPVKVELLVSYDEWGYASLEP